MGFITASREQLTLFGYSLDDFVDLSARCRFIAKVVATLDLNELYGDYSSQGGDAFDPGILLATWFLAYSEGETSTRRLERLCGRDMHYIYTSANLKPDHCSLSRFRQRHLGRLPGYFMQIIRIAAEQGVSDFRLIGIDGSKLQAGCSPRQSRTGKALEEELQKVRGRIAEYLQRCELMDEEESVPQDLPGLREKIARLQQLEKKLAERQSELMRRRAELQLKDRKKHRINLVEPEARQMNPVNGRLSIPGYNVQASVDTRSQLIVAADVTDERTDQKQFASQHQQAEANLGADVSRQYVADAGYHSLEQLAYVKEHQVDAVIADPRPERRREPTNHATAVPARAFDRGSFHYDPKTDTYRCPANEVLPYAWQEKQHGRSKRIYQGQTCVGCTLRMQCLKTTNPHRLRTVGRDQMEELAEAMLQKARSPDGRHRLDIRRMSSEPAFGNLKSNLGFHRFNLRGISKVKGEFFLMCIGHNLSKLHRLLKDRSGLPRQSLSQTLSAVQNAFRLRHRSLAASRSGSFVVFTIRAAA
jgi:transposase